ncbi:MAG: c-type cytochrome [Magnetococcales bacterium]|nr:c-type cytochrome [Magnetococcales bacterium]
MQVRHILLYGVVAIAFILLIVGGWFRSQPDPEMGKRLVTNSCEICHDLTTAKNQERGPYLWGVYNRPAGVTGYSHSEGFLAKVSEEGFIWDDEHLDQFISNPGAFIPRTQMGKPSAKHPTAFDGIVSDANRKDVLAYLKSLR